MAASAAGNGSKCKNTENPAVSNCHISFGLPLTPPFSAFHPFPIPVRLSYLYQTVTRLLKSVFTFLLCLLAAAVSAQVRPVDGMFVLEGSVRAPGPSEPPPRMNLLLSDMRDSTLRFRGVSEEDGGFRFSRLPKGCYSLQMSHAGFGSQRIDSILLDDERPLAVLPPIDPASFERGMETIVVHARRPLVEQKDGNIVFNASESPIAQGSNASELLRSVPMVSMDAEGNPTVKGREPRILVDDRPVDMNARQLQDFLESMPGGLIERIEVMVNPPPQYANEPGGVINIVTRKGRTGFGGRVAVHAGTRGEGGVNGSLNHRSKGLNLQLQAGIGFTTLMGEGRSDRENRFPDSTNRLLTEQSFVNRSLRPSFRLNVEQEAGRRGTLGLTVQLNRNTFRNGSSIDYANLNRFGEAHRRSVRDIRNHGDRPSSSFNLSYTLRGARKGEQLRLLASHGRSGSYSLRDFRQSFFDGDMRPTLGDSAQEQHEDDIGRSLQLRATYDRPFAGDRTILSLTATHQLNRSHVVLDGFDKDPASGDLTAVPRLGNEFRFRQTVEAARLSLKQRLGEGFWLTAGSGLERTGIRFDLVRDSKNAENGYLNWMPFANLSRNWGEGRSLTLVYRRTLRRPGIRELNPAMEYNDPYNVRYGNPYLAPSSSHTFDLAYGRATRKLQFNAGVGYNRVQGIFAMVRSLKEAGVTEATWYNIGDKDEFEGSGWIVWTPDKAVRIDGNITYTYNRFERSVVEANRFRNGGSMQARAGLSLNPSPQWSLSANLSVDRIANPQGAVRSTVATVIGGQYRLLKRRMSVALNLTDPFFQQRHRSVTEGARFRTEGYSLTRTRNVRLTVSYSFNSQKATGKTGKAGNAVKPVEAKKGVSEPQRRL